MVLFALVLAVQEAPAPACPAQPAPPPPAFLGWTARTGVAAGTAEAGAPLLAVGSGVDARLSGSVTYVLAPEKSPATGTNGGLFRVHVAKAGTLAIGLGAPVWIDLLQGGKALAPASFGHGVPCTGIRKLVRYAVAPGDYLLQLSGSASATLGLVVGEE